MARHNRRLPRLTACTLLPVLLGLATATHGTQTYRWVDERGRVHYGDTLPPQAREPVLLDKQGRTVRTMSRPGSPTPATTRPANASDQRERQDRALLATYLDEAEIDLARDRALAQERARQDSLQAMIEQTRGRLARFKRQANQYALAGQPIPATIEQSVEAAQREIDQLTELLARSERSAEAIEARYAAFKQRFRELKAQMREPASASPSANGGRGQ